MLDELRKNDDRCWTFCDSITCDNDGKKNKRKTVEPGNRETRQKYTRSFLFLSFFLPREEIRQVRCALLLKLLFAPSHSFNGISYRIYKLDWLTHFSGVTHKSNNELFLNINRRKVYVIPSRKEFLLFLYVVYTSLHCSPANRNTIDIIGLIK